MKKNYYRVGGQLLEVTVPATWDLDRLLPSFLPFRCEAAADAVLFRFRVVPQPAEVAVEGTLLDASTSDLGNVKLYRIADGYRVEVLPIPGQCVHILYADAAFTRLEAVFSLDDPHFKEAFVSMLRIAFSQAILRRDGVLLHAAAVVWHERAYLFLGKSGTGKSTHAASWMRVLPDCLHLNDDNPLVRWEAGRAVAYGTPWSGKTPCYKNLRYEVGGIVRLAQAPENRFQPCRDIESFVMLLPSVSVIPSDEPLYDAMCTTLTHLAETLPMGQLCCLPDEEAVHVCMAGLDIVFDENKQREI